MKIAELDWPQMLGMLRRWDALSPAARRAYLALKPAVGSSRAQMGEDAAEQLLAAGLVAPPSARSTLLAVTPETRRMHVLLRAMGRVRVLDAPGDLPPDYIKEHFTSEQTVLLAGEGPRHHHWGTRAQDAGRVSTVDWVQAVLDLPDADAARRWEQPRRAAGEEGILAVPWTLRTVQQLILALADHPNGVPFSALETLLPDAGPAVRAEAVRAGLRYMLLFPALRGADLQACIGLLPAVAQRLGPPPAAPAPVQAAETFEAPFRLGDMTAVLVEAATEPLPVRSNNQGLYVRTQKLLAARLASLPAWVAEHVLDDEDEDDEDLGIPGAWERIAQVIHWLVVLKLVEVVRTQERYAMQPTAAGRRWLAEGEGERLKVILSAVRASPQRNPDGRWGADGPAFFATYLGLTVSDRDMDLRADLCDALLSIPTGAMVELDGWLEWHGRERNPFLQAGRDRLRHRIVYGRPFTREMWEAAWMRLLEEFLVERLLPFGGARLGRLEDERVAFGITPAGRYLLGGADDFAFAPAPEGDVLVQPDFEIVFLAPAPRVEAELGRFAERTGSGVGALFRITRASVLRAAEQGVTADALVGTLEGVSRGGVPANVARQVRDWIGGTRRVSLRPAVLVECPDAETAGRVRAVGGAQVTPVTPTLLRLDTDGKGRASLVKKLREKGIFVED